jgi:hypothetical protein
LLYFEELAHTVVRAGKSKTCRAGWQTGDAGEEVICSFHMKAIWRQNSFFLLRPHFFFLGLELMG